MHEFPITQQIVKLAEETAKKSNAGKITRISLIMGELSGFVEESIRMYFEIIAKGTLAEDAKLEITYVESKMFCPNCKTYFKREKYSFDCPDCKMVGEPTKIGKEFYIEDIEVEN